MGSAILLISCDEKTTSKDVDAEKLMTQQSDSLVLLASENGQTKYRFETPLLERYELAKEPYMEFRKGVDVITYDSIGNVASTLVANYAIFFEKQKLWEAKGNVVVVNADGQTLETQQLFWNQKTKKIYSNVDSKVVDGDNTIIGEGFESDEEFKDYIFRKPKGKVLVDVEPTDSTNVEQPQPSDSKVNRANDGSKDVAPEARQVNVDQKNVAKPTKRGESKIVEVGAEANRK